MMLSVAITKAAAILNMYALNLDHGNIYKLKAKFIQTGDTGIWMSGDDNTTGVFK